MTATIATTAPILAVGSADRFRLNRAGILNVWQYDDQVFTFADGRLLLRGANGAGKSKTLEMLLPFALDGDKARITASAKHHTSLLWLMTDGLDGGNRVGYVWVEFLRVTADGLEETYTCGVGIRASASARSASAWHFATDRRIGSDLSLEDDAGPLSMPRLKEVLGAEHVFEKSGDYKAHVGRSLFGLDPAAYDEVLRLLYWLRQPQVGEDIEPAKLAVQLSQALPQLDEQAVRAAGETFDELTAFGEQIERRSAAAAALAQLADAYGGYARAVLAERARAVVEGLRGERRQRSLWRAAGLRVEQVHAAREQALAARDAARTGIEADAAALRTLEDSPEFRDQRRLGELEERAQHDAAVASEAEQRCIEARATVTQRDEAVAARARQSEERLAQQRERVRDLDQRQREAVPGSGVPGPALLDGVRLTRLDQLPAVAAALDQCLVAVRGARSAASLRMAGLRLLRAALGRVADRATAQLQAEREAEQAESRWEAARKSRVSAEQEAQGELARVTAALGGWAVTPGAPGMVVPEDLTDEWLAALPGSARDAAAPQLRGIRDAQLRESTRRDSAQVEWDRLAADRAEVEATRDPSPPPSPLPRTDRVDGTALWRVVDFRGSVADQERAGLEAALQAAGLLDAWVRPGGLLLDPEHHDVVLVASPEVAGGLNDLLVPDLPSECDLSPEDVHRILAAISVGEDPAAPAAVRDDGTWRLGPALGRAAKDRPQYVGATARAAERARRLAVLDAAIAEARERVEVAAEALAALAEAEAVLEAWVDAAPSGGALMRVRTLVAERRDAEVREEQSNRVAQKSAHEAREATSQARRELAELALEQELPVDRGALDALEQALRGLDEDLRDVERDDPPVRELLRHWQDSVAAANDAQRSLAGEIEQAAEAARRANVSRAQYESLRESVGDSVDQLQTRIAEVRTSRTAHEAAERDAARQVEALILDTGQAIEAAGNAEARLTEQLQARSAALDSLAAAGAVPGLIEAAGVSREDADLLPGLVGHPAGEPVGRVVAATAERLAALSQEEAVPAGTRVWRTHNEASSGPAADHQLTILEFGNLLAVSGRDDAGEAAVVALAHRVRSGVDRDRDLLTEREKQQFEQHVLGELGDAIRACRRDAEELVAAMNDQLGHVTTSQGIRVRLDWRLRDDVPPDARAAVALLVQPVGALIPEERADLRDALHRLIEASRVERPELSYGEHLAGALDYRTWSAFTIRYTRPETPGHWDRLHRRSALSQGEQKVLCYLPLFAAAAAHFTSLAGAAPYAPRLVLLDDAFPKIDVRTHPLLFGLLVQLDLDFVITSERLWGDHATVPSLAIYEALRDPSQRGIAQYEYRWDGRVLQGIG